MIGPDRWLGRLIRLPLRLVPSQAVVRVVSGPNRGYRWLVGSGVHGYWTGTYEHDQVRRFLDRARPAAVVWDVGANAGYYTLAAARRVGASGRVVAIEALPENVSNLRRHVGMNRLATVDVIEAAVTAMHGGTARFEAADSRAQGRVGAGELPVRSVTLDGLVVDGYPAPDLVKMDIEGGEADALDGAASLLAGRRTVWLVALHGPDIARRCFTAFLNAGYRLSDLEGRALAIADAATCWALWATPDR